MFTEGNIFKTEIPLKRIATEKFGAINVSQDVSQDVPQNVPQKSDKDIKIEIIKMIKRDNKVSREVMGKVLGKSEKSISRYIKDIPNIRYVGRGSNGHWEIN